MLHKTILFCVLFLFFISCNSSLIDDIKDLGLKKNNAYIVLKGSKGKLLKNISKYNLIHIKTSRVAIGIVDSASFFLYHVTTSENKVGKNYYVEPVDSFLSNDSDIVFLAIYKLNLNTEEFKSLKSNLQKNKSYEYDYEFIDSNNKYYCSEFAVDMIHKSTNNYRFKKFKFKVNDFIGLLTKDNTLNIYPIDFITESQNAKLIYLKEP